MMGLNEGDRAIVREIAFEAAKETARLMEQHFEDRLKLHALGCPVKADFESAKNQATGGWRTLAAIGGFLAGVGALVAELWPHK